MSKTNDEIDRNASASINGWFFQISTGIYLFFKDIKNNLYLNIEGSKEDIEIKTKYGKVYAQVKCLYDVDKRDSVGSHYNKALKSLNDCSGDNVKLLYVSNICDPFNTRNKKYYDYGTSYSFNDLDAKAKNKIKKILGDNFKYYDNLSVDILHFYGNKESKKKLVIKELSYFLQKAIKDDSKSRVIYDELITENLINATHRSYEISKEKLVYYVVLPYLKETMREEEFSKVMDEEYYFDCHQIYEKVLSELEWDYTNIIRILSDYIENKTSYNNKYDYIKQKWSKYEELVEYNGDSKIKEGLIKILLLEIFKKDFVISNIKKEADI